MTFRAPLARALLLLPILALAGCVTEKGPAPSAARAPVRSEARPPEPVKLADSGPRYETLIARYAAENGVPVGLALAVVQKESRYNPRATGRGTIGLMQIKHATARGIGYKGSASALYDPDTNLRWGMLYLGTAYRLGGKDVCGAALRYQGGHRATRMTASSRRYCSDLKAIMARNGR
jgi:soluble lytic murein transglycosylase-like protein